MCVWGLGPVSGSGPPAGRGTVGVGRGESGGDGRDPSWFVAALDFLMAAVSMGGSRNGSGNGESGLGPRGGAPGIGPSRKKKKKKKKKSAGARRGGEGEAGGGRSGDGDAILVRYKSMVDALVLICCCLDI
jgi:hypothetical protein